MNANLSHERRHPSLLMIPPLPLPQSAAQQFASLVQEERQDESICLATAALGIARLEYPQLECGHYLDRLDELASRVRTRMRSNPSSREVTALLAQVLFREEGLRGNREDYYDPRNSFLNDVLDRKLGIPITLSVVYMEVARRVGFPVAGVGMPGHFLLKHYDVMSGEIIIDAFDHGRILAHSECQQRLNEIYSGQVELVPEFLQPVTHRQILARMLHNLRQIYLKQENLPKALATLDMLLAIPPRSAELLRERALLRIKVDQYVGAARDLAMYLKLQPEAPDAEDVKETLDMVRQLVSRLN